uniref:G-patch domain-containing protein n=1 Tax=Octactis speculum TaxID=3111310 RepID=A0A7S2BY99_9STRA|mmetsp:Transcript_28920/g.39370  ORF Transcript_28920/g.39370 Transcript_28920/m.39370 type:complete len:315 (+) Transcript_28920:89-1033(+)
MALVTATVKAGPHAEQTAAAAAVTGQTGHAMQHASSPLSAPAGSIMPVLPPHHSTTAKHLLAPTHNVESAALPRDHAAALPENMDAAASKQYKMQKEMQMLEARIRDSAQAQMSKEAKDLADAQLHEERLKAYTTLAEKDSEDAPKDTVEEAEYFGGVIEGGTWEHRKRAKEMLATADSALNLTLSGKAGHHISDFIPKDELDTFLNKAEAVTTGEEVKAEQDFKKNMLDASNIGFQMLQKAGWKEGEGLGASAAGIVAPVDMNKKAGEGHGLGVKDTHAVEQDDDVFDQYRKRMMLAYRFRPNPLNNPRRSYY